MMKNSFDTSFIHENLRTYGEASSLPLTLSNLSHTSFGFTCFLNEYDAHNRGFLIKSCNIGSITFDNAKGYVGVEVQDSNLCGTRFVMPVEDVKVASSRFSDVRFEFISNKITIRDSTLSSVIIGGVFEDICRSSWLVGSLVAFSQFQGLGFTMIEGSTLNQVCFDSCRFRCVMGSNFIDCEFHKCDFSECLFRWCFVRFEQKEDFETFKNQLIEQKCRGKVETNFGTIELIKQDGEEQ